jgi:transposase InsO family protein
VETLREYKCILLGHLITIYTDHKNLTFSNFTTDRITRWRLIVEEYGPKIVYLPGKCNIIANALSRLPKLEPHDKSAFLEEIFALDEQTDAFPIAFDVISKAQLADKKIQRCITNNDPDFETRIIQQAPLVYFKGKIAIPTNLRFRILTWYHENLLHPGNDRMFHTISQHFTWPSLRTQVENFVKHCNTCQHYKAQRKKYGHIPVPDKQQITNPWHSIAVDTIGPWIILQLPHSSKSKEPTTLQALTIIDLSTHFMEIVALKNKESITVACSLDQVWLCHYPRPIDCLHDNGTEFISTEFQELLQSYGIQSKLTTVKNPQANGILECTHQVIGNLLGYIPIASSLKTSTPYLPNRNFSCQLCGPSTPHFIQP